MIKVEPKSAAPADADIEDLCEHGLASAELFDPENPADQTTLRIAQELQLNDHEALQLQCWIESFIVKSPLSDEQCLVVLEKLERLSGLALTRAEVDLQRELEKGEASEAGDPYEFRISGAINQFSRGLERLEKSLKKRDPVEAVEAALNGIQHQIEADKYKYFYALENQREVGSILKWFLGDIDPSDRSLAVDMLNTLASDRFFQRDLISAFSERLQELRKRRDCSSPESVAGCNLKNTLKELLRMYRDPGKRELLQRFQERGGWGAFSGSALALAYPACLREIVRNIQTTWKDVEAAMPDPVRMLLQGYTTERLDEPKAKFPFGYLQGFCIYTRIRGDKKDVVEVRWHTPNPAESADETPVLDVFRDGWHLAVLNGRTVSDVGQEIDRLLGQKDAWMSCIKCHTPNSIWIAADVRSAALKRKRDSEPLLKMLHVPADPLQAKERQAGVERVA